METTDKIQLQLQDLKDKGGSDRDLIQLRRALLAVERYKAGEPIVSIAKDFGCTPDALYDTLRTQLTLREWDNAKTEALVARAKLKNIKYNRITAMAADNVLMQLEACNSAKQPMDIKDLCQIEKVFGDRNALEDGQVTERIGTKIEIVKFAESQRQIETTEQDIP